MMRRDAGPWLAWILLAVALLLLVLSESGALSPLESLLGFVVAPVERGASVVARSVRSLVGSTRDVQALQQRVAELEEANEVLVQENFRLREYQAENEELRRQLSFAQDNPSLDVVGADVVERGCTRFPCGEVVGEDINPYLRYIIINVGSLDGVAAGMPVVTGGSALIGRVARTSRSLAYVQLINDPQSRVAAMLQESRVTGIVEGTDESQMVMTNILPDETVNEGETIITSSLGGMLPRNLIMGQVESIGYQESDLFQQAVVRPAVDYRRVETVLVVTDFPQPNLEELDVPEVPVVP